MNSHMLMIFLALCGELIQQSSSQKFNFKDSITFDKGSSKVHPGNWTLDGDIVLTTTDLILFQPKISFQTCHDVCVVDLTKCSPEKIPNHQDSCFCKEKSGDIYRIHVGSTVKVSQSDATLKATVPSRPMFGAISGNSVVGVFPTITDSKTNIQARYRVDKGVSKELLPSQKISVCPNKYVPIRVCVSEKRPEAILTFGIQGDMVTTSVSTCVVFVNEYNFDNVPVHKLTFSIVESTYKTTTDVSMIYIQENNQCHPSTVAPKTTPLSAQANVVDSLHEVTKVVTDLKLSVHSLKQDFDKAMETLNKSKETKCASIESDNQQLKDMLNKAAKKIDGHSTHLSSLQSDHNEIMNLVQSLNSSTAGSLDEISRHMTNNFDALLQNVDCEIHFCSNGNLCEPKPKTSRSFRCFRVDKDTQVSWYEAVKKCKSIGGVLAEINDKQTLEYVKKVVARSGLANIWLGASDEGHEGEWMWVTSGKKMSVTDWGPGEPNNHMESNEHCLHIARGTGNKWNDAPCKTKLNYICEKNSYDQDCGSWL